MINIKPYSCYECGAACTFEAMNWCVLEAKDCPVIQKLQTGEIVDRRPTDADPTFPSEFSLSDVNKKG